MSFGKALSIIETSDLSCTIRDHIFFRRATTCYWFQFHPARTAPTRAATMFQCFFRIVLRNVMRNLGNGDMKGVIWKLNKTSNLEPRKFIGNRTIHRTKIDGSRPSGRVEWAVDTVLCTARSAVWVGNPGFELVAIVSCCVVRAKARQSNNSFTLQNFLHLKRRDSFSTTKI